MKNYEFKIRYKRKWWKFDRKISLDGWSEKLHIEIKSQSGFLPYLTLNKFAGEKGLNLVAFHYPKNMCMKICVACRKQEKRKISRIWKENEWRLCFDLFLWSKKAIFIDNARESSWCINRTDPFYWIIKNEILCLKTNILINFEK